MKKKWNVLPFWRGSDLLLHLKFLTFFLFVFVIQTNASVYSQNAKLSLKVKDTSMEDVLKLFEEQSDFSFIYRSDLFQNEEKIDLNVKNIRIEDFLKDYVVPNGYTYEVVNQTVIIKEETKPDKPNETKSEKQDDKKVTGKVSDNDGAPLPGVTITVLGETRGVITDIDGKFEISNIEPTDKLVFSFIGMADQIIEVNNRTNVNVILQQKTEELEDVTVVAFGKQKKESVLASITTVKPSELKVPSSNLTTALAGRMSGIISYQRSGEPGADNAEFFIRGVTTFGYKKDPLILIDGVELSSSDLARMQPDDIASFSIMKDATATALYGARGANGVILVTTKEGKEGKANVSIRFENSFSSPTQDIKFADPVTYMRLHNEAIKTRDPLGILLYSKSKIDNTEKGENPLIYPANDWHDMLFKDQTVNQRLNFNVSGGGKVARYYLAGTASQDNGVLKVDDRNNFNSNIDLKRYLLRSNINIDITKTTEAVVRLHATFDDYTGPIDGGTALYNKVMRSNPALFPAYYPLDENTKYTQHIMFGNHGSGNYINPYAEMVKGYRDETTSMMLAQFELKQDLNFITEGLSARFLSSVNRYSNFNVSRFYNPFYYQAGGYNRLEETYTLNLLNETEGTEYLNYNEGSKNITSNSYFEAATDYNRTFNKHGVSALLVFTRREQQIANAGDLQRSLPYRNIGLSGRFTYSYDSRYYTEFNFGYNGSERFAENERFGFFPSAGIGWNISNEIFWSGLKKTISQLKFKATYGLVGNDAIGSANDRFFYLSSVNLSNGGRGMYFGRNWGEFQSGVSIGRYANDQITWEIAKKGNVGIELELFEKLMINADWFKEERSNMLMSRASIPATMGLQSSVRANVGIGESEGFDMSLDYNHSFNNDLWLTARANFTYSTNKWTQYEEPDYASVGLSYLSAIGHNFNQQWGLVAERLFVDEDEIYNSPVQNFGEYKAGDIKYYDVNNDGQVNDLDKVPIGYPTIPEIVYGFGVSTGYNGFDLSVFFQGSARSSFWIDPQNTAPFVDVDGDGGIISNNALLQVWADNYWSEEQRNITASWPRLSTTVIQNNTQRSTWFMRDGSFLRLKSAEFGYTLPKSLTKRANIEQLRLYVSGTNLLTFSKFKLWDPEMAGNGLGYPVQRVVNLGIQLSF
ncbi:TonB-dependent receptor [Draconibacterium sediminis]|uniref:TonB-dependent receptor n=1 Tax=Draconibacterium sediminis TaxID=1544798 RepID=UPI0005D309F2|nr:TonB-dependent receptor [Draconibacterium sediminis]